MANKPWKVDHCVDIRFNTSVERTERVLDVSEAFGLELKDKEFVIYDNLKFSTYSGIRLYITGQSGSGKSLILRHLEKDFIAKGLKVANIENVTFDDKPIVEQIGDTTEEATKLLQIAGIGDAYLLIRKPSELSDGQKYRLKIAKLMQEKADVWLCDEFGAVLDRKTAKLLAFSIWKMAKKTNTAVAIATTHKDLVMDFGTNLLIYKQYAHEVKLTPLSDDWFEEY